jgi:hypothetical protein
MNSLRSSNNGTTPVPHTSYRPILTAALIAAFGAGLAGPFAPPSRAIVTEAESGAHVQPPQQRYFHRTNQILTVLGPKVFSSRKWEKRQSPWTDPLDADFAAVSDGSGVAVLPEAGQKTK